MKSRKMNNKPSARKFKNEYVRETMKYLEHIFFRLTSYYAC